MSSNFRKKSSKGGPVSSDASHGARSGAMRLQRALAAAGCGSRRQCEQLILDGRVEVDDQPVVQLGTKVDPSRQKISLDGELLRSKRLSYFAVNKPPGILSTSKDPAGRFRVIDLIPSDQRLYNVGRLDKSSEGLMVVTNDGELAQRLTHPKFGIPKTYRVLVAGHPHPEQLQQLEQGVRLAEGWAKASRVETKKRTRTGTWLEMTLEEGKNREIRRLLARIGHKVTRLVRVAIGPVHLGELAVGDHRKLTREEVAQLMTWQPPKRTAGARPKRAPKTAGSRSRQLSKGMTQTARRRRRPASQRPAEKRQRRG